VGLQGGVYRSYLHRQRHQPERCVERCRLHERADGHSQPAVAAIPQRGAGQRDAQVPLGG